MSAGRVRIVMNDWYHFSRLKSAIAPPDDNAGLLPGRNCFRIFIDAMSGDVIAGWQAVRMPDGNVYYQNKFVVLETDFLIS
jgi:hypothetical protein